MMNFLENIILPFLGVIAVAAFLAAAIAEYGIF